MIKNDSVLLNEALRAKEALFNHGVIAFPTETVMGLGVLYNDYEAYQKLNKVKERPEDKPYTLMLHSVSEIEKYAVVDERIRRVINKFMPGPLTILVPVKNNSVPAYVTHGTNVIGMRVPVNKEAREVLLKAELPLLVPSANKSGKQPATSSKEVEEIFGNEIDFIVSGNAQLGVPSTIVDLTKETPKVVREGAISETMILEIWNK